MFVFIKDNKFCMREPGKQKYDEYDDYRLFSSDLKVRMTNAKEIQAAVLRQTESAEKTDQSAPNNVSQPERRRFDRKPYSFK